MSNIQQIEKFFSGVGYVCQIVGATVLLILFGHYMLGGGAFIKNFLTTGEVEKVDGRFASPVYDGFPEKIEYWTEFNKAWGEHFEPYYHWRRNSFEGKYINVSSDGVRLTTKTSKAAGSKKIFMLGGSTMWGTGSPDNKTIPSIMQSLLGPRYDVYNYGETAYVSTQELNYLLYQLALGNIPDAVIFYDGVNDGYAGAYSPAIPRDPHNLRFDSNQEKNIALELFDKSNYKRLADFIGANLFNLRSNNRRDRNDDLWDEQITPNIDRNSRAVIDMYEAHIKQVNALSQEYGFEAYFFWQPHLFSLSRTKMNSFEENEIERYPSAHVKSQQKVYQFAKERFSNREDENIYFLGNIFDDVDEPIYIDTHHVGPNGNEIIAKEMFQRAGLTR